MRHCQEGLASVCDVPASRWSGYRKSARYNRASNDFKHYNMHIDIAFQGRDHKSQVKRFLVLVGAKELLEFAAYLVANRNTRTARDSRPKHSCIDLRYGSGSQECLQHDPDVKELITSLEIYGGTSTTSMSYLTRMLSTMRTSSRPSMRQSNIYQGCSGDTAVATFVGSARVRTPPKPTEQHPWFVIRVSMSVGTHQDGCMCLRT